MSEIFNVIINDQLTDIAELKVAQLKIELKKRGISTTGNKQELHDKLKAFLNKQQNDESILNESLNTSITKQHNTSAANMSRQSDSFIELNNNLQKDSLVSNNETSSSFNEQLENHKKKQQEEEEAATAAAAAALLFEEKLKQQQQEEEKATKLEANDYSNSIMTPTLSETDNSIKNGELVTETNVKIISNEQESVNSRETSTERSESCIKEVPMSGDRNRFSRSKSPKPRWQSSDEAPTPQIQSDPSTEEIKPQSDTVLEEPASAIKPDEPTAAAVSTENEIPKVQRKRKWLSNDTANILTSKKQLTISSDTLKSYLPANSNENNKGGEEEQTTELITNNVKVVEQESKSTESEASTTEIPTKTTIIRQTTRTVIFEDNNEEPIQDVSDGNLNGNKTEHASSSSFSAKLISNILHIVNLTRPFTLNQFKELLTKFGPLKKLENSDTEHYFWINSVKSHCYVAFENEASASLARQGLNNTTWPQSNPKQLQVEYSTMDDLLLHMNENNHKLPIGYATNTNLISKQNNIQKQITQILNENEDISSKSSSNKSDKTLNNKKEKSSSHDTNETNNANNNNNKSTKSVREWDLPKLANDSASLSRDETRKHSNTATTDEHHTSDKSEHRKKPKIEEEAPPKTLDDLFKKTAALPHIYWLPLTDEQFIERQKDNERRNLERIKRAEERLLKETEAAAANSQKDSEQQQVVMANGSGSIKEEIKKETNGTDAKESSEQVVRPPRPRDDDRRDYRNSDRDSDKYKRRPNDYNNDRQRNYGTTNNRSNANRYASPDRSSNNNKKDEHTSRRKRTPSNSRSRSRSSSSGGSSSSSSGSRRRSRSTSKNSYTKEKKSILSVNKER